jgi:hypothetical protein
MVTFFNVRKGRDALFINAVDRKPDRVRAEIHKSAEHLRNPILCLTAISILAHAGLARHRLKIRKIPNLDGARLISFAQKERKNRTDRGARTMNGSLRKPREAGK